MSEGASELISLEISMWCSIIFAETVRLFSDAEEQLGKKNPFYKEYDIVGTTCPLIIYLNEAFNPTLPQPRSDKPTLIISREDRQHDNQVGKQRKEGKLSYCAIIPRLLRSLTKGQNLNDRSAI